MYVFFLYGRGQYTRDPVPQTVTSSTYFLGVVADQSKSLDCNPVMQQECVLVMCMSPELKRPCLFGGTLWD